MFVRAPVLAGYSSIMVISVFLAFLSLQGSERVPILPRELSADQVASLTVAELLERMPLESWDGNALKPVPAEMQRRAEAGRLSDNDWRQAILAADLIHTRSRWPAETPLRVWIRDAAWLRRARITAKALDPEIGTVSANDLYPSYCSNCNAGRTSRQRRLAFGKLPRATHYVDLDVTILPPDGFSGHPTVVWFDEHWRCQCQGRSNSPDLRREAEGRPEEIRDANGVVSPRVEKWKQSCVSFEARSWMRCLASSA